MKSVGIIGAGAAGLSAAAKLAREHEGELKITIIEARSRIGGRIQSTDLFGADVVQGSEWVADGCDGEETSCIEMGT